MGHSITPERAKIYSFKKEFSPLHASAIMLGYDPIFLESLSFSNSPEYETAVLLRDVLSELAFNGTFKNYLTDISHGLNFSEEYVTAISAEELKAWALSNGYKWLSVNETSLQNNTNQDQISELQARIAELEAENQNLKKPEAQADNYNPTERETHLQIIAIQSFDLAKLKSSYLTETGKVKRSTMATVLEREAKELFANPKSSDTYRKRIAEALKTYSPRAD